MTPRARNRMLGVVVVFCGLALTVGFALWGFSGRITFFYTPHELVSIPDKAIHKTIRLGGMVVKGSLHQDRTTNFFDVTDMVATTAVEYDGILPDLFREGQGVVAQGKYDRAQNKFIATQVLAKHDEKYMPPELVKSLQKAQTKN